MARWRLLKEHYLKVQDTYWEHVEQSRDTGKTYRKLVPVPMYLHHETDNNYPGETVVCHKGKGAPKDYVFEGPPTPDMEPMDDEAKMISKEWEPAWRHPIESLPPTGEYSQSLITAFEKQMQDLKAVTHSISVPKDDFEKLKADVAAMARQNAELRAALSAKK